MLVGPLDAEEDFTEPPSASTAFCVEVAALRRMLANRSTTWTSNSA